jgi:hypothetical protein
MTSFRSFNCRLLIFTFIPLMGCADPYAGRHEVSGSVKLKNQPIKDGAMVEFVPLENQGTGSSTMTKNGSYKLPRASGLKPGKYLVRVSLGDGKTAVNPVNEGAPPGPTGGTNIISKELVPREWNVNSKQERTIKADEDNVFDLDIQ